MNTKFQDRSYWFRWERDLLVDDPQKVPFLRNIKKEKFLHGCLVYFLESSLPCIGCIALYSHERSSSWGHIYSPWVARRILMWFNKDNSIYNTFCRFMRNNKTSDTPSKNDLEGRTSLILTYQATLAFSSCCLHAVVIYETSVWSSIWIKV